MEERERESRKLQRCGSKESKRQEWQGYSVFVNNVPLQMDSHGLRGVFARAGRISDVHIPLKIGRKSNMRHGFVRFWQKEDAVRSTMLFNSLFVRVNALELI